MMDEITETLVRLILETDLTDRPDLLQQAKIAFLDYLASALRALPEKKVEELGNWAADNFPGTALLLGRKEKAHPIAAAFYNGFQSHYLDLDDAQANIAGHFSTVLFSVLLAESNPETSAQDFLTAYTVGAEVEGILGSFINPRHKWQGWHSTGTLGPIGGAAALAKLKHWDKIKTAELLSLGATQSSGLGLEAGSDGKPLHSGFAARNAVNAYEILAHTDVSASLRPFNPENGWLQVFANLPGSAADWNKLWLAPGQILKPGLWMKIHPYCSAAICGTAACKKIFAGGWKLKDLKQVVFHFPPGADKALHYKAPRTGQEGRFSMEYVGWQVLTRGKVEDALFEKPEVPSEFTRALPKLVRMSDLPKVEKTVRRIVVTAETLEGETIRAEVPEPLGSPEHPFTEDDLAEKLTYAGGKRWTKKILDAVQTWPQGKLKTVLPLLEGKRSEQHAVE